MIGVLIELSDQGLHAAEFLGIAESRHEIDPHSRTVQIKVGIEKMRLDHRLRVTERWTGAKVDHPVVRPPRCLHPGRVDPFRRQEFPGTGNAHVCGGESDDAAPPRSLHHLPPERVGASEAPKCFGQVATGDSAADCRRRNGLSAVHGDSRYDIDFEPPCRAETPHRGRIPGAVVTKPVVITHEQVVHAEPAQQDLVDKALGAERGEGWRERQHCDEVDSRLGEDLELFITDGKESRRCGRIHDLERVRIKRDEQAVEAQTTGALGELAENVLVAKVDTIKTADGDRGASHVRRQTGVGRLVSHR